MLSRTWKSIDDLSKILLHQVEEFLVSYNRQRGKEFQITGGDGPKKAVEFVATGIETFCK